MINIIDDLGIKSFTEMGRDYIINNCCDTSWFDEAMEESHQSYIDDIKNEKASNEEEFDSRLEEEMAEMNCDDEEDYLEHLNSIYEDGVEWYLNNFGEDDFLDRLNEFGNLDIEKICELCKDVDGRGHNLSLYNGEELELEDNYYAYRIG